MTKKERIRAIGNKCEECDLDGQWNGKPLTMHFHDHGKDSNKLLCPNCHSQTDTYAGKASWKNENERIAFYERHSDRMKENNPMHVLSYREKLSRAKMGHTPWNKGKKCPQISEGLKRKGKKLGQTDERRAHSE